ncbi:hypothetical protein [Actinomadura atramentaria]|uniref:hypothetical protein n=1 Tax=Actinomadura atramentaria TaxID=1990 RepID=UPI0003792445|nr:hypothetical protein [Actinomadura atramentaria]
MSRPPPACYRPVGADVYVGLRLGRPGGRDATGPPPRTLVVGSTRSSAVRAVATDVHDVVVSPAAVRSSGAAPGPSPLPTTPVPTLGQVWGSDQEGYGTVLPPMIFNGGDPTGVVENVVWSGWGEPAATATGTALWAPDGVSEGTMEPARVVASDLGDCRGALAYRRVTWYFPQHGQRPPDEGTDICPD